MDDTDRDFPLVRRAAAGEENAFRELFNGYVGRIYAFCLRLSADEHLAEELTQEVFIKAWEKIQTFQFISKFSTWLHSIAMNEFLMQKRASKRLSERISEFGRMMRSSERPGSTGYHFETRIDLENAIAGLPERARAVLILHDIEGYKHDEISRIMNVETGTSKAHLHRARKLLREAIIK